jgi:outer membrane protein assembly factor BamB
LRAGQSADFVGVNSDGTVYALEGATGAALWTARYVPGRQASGANASTTGIVFVPVAVKTSTGETSNVLVAFDGGVRLLEGESGRELWRAALKGRATGGCAAELDGDEASQEIAVTTDDQQLYVLNASSGAVVSQTKLDNEVIGLPIPFQNGAERGVALTLKGAQVEVRLANGKRLRGVKFDVPFITPPLVLAGARGTLVIVASEHGLLYMDGTLKPLGRVTTEGESPRGRLAAADLDGDGVLEVVMVTNHDRIVVVSGGGKIVWSAQGARDAYTPAFADLNGDGLPDVLVADSGVFARGFSGRDGTLIWQADDERSGTNATRGPGDETNSLRSLAVASGGANASPLVVGGDHTRNALRAVGLPSGSVKVALK